MDVIVDVNTPHVVLHKRTTDRKILQHLKFILAIVAVQMSQMPQMPQNPEDPGPPAEAGKNPASLAPADSKINHAASINYWSSLDSTSSNMLGMLGTYPWYSRIELQGSKNFLTKVRRLLPALPPNGKFPRGVDCGAGVGRVTDGFLRHVCDVVDAVEPVAKFTQVLQDGKLKEAGIVGDIYTVGLERWVPPKKYDLVWIQWCVGHLTDSQLIKCITQCRSALTESGLVVVKENLSTDLDDQDMYDDLDSSVTRTDAKFRHIFAAAGMDVIKAEIQTGFPKQFKLLPVKSYALRPRI